MSKATPPRDKENLTSQVDFAILGTALNMLDSWLPIADLLVKEGKRGAAIVPYAFILERASPNDTLVKMADEILSSFIVFRGTRISRYSSLEDAIRESLEVSQNKLLKNFLRRARTLASRILLRSRINQKLVLRNVDHLLSRIQGKTLLYDVSNHGRDNSIHNLLARRAAGKGFRFFSISHAPVPVWDGTTISIPQQWTHFCHMQASNDCNLHAESDAVFHVGIPRHDDMWAKRLIEESRNLHGHVIEPNAVLLSHGSGTQGFSEKGKVFATRQLKSVLDSLKVELLIKKHPTEILSTDLKDSETRGHPLHILNDSKLAFFFMSSTVADALFLGKPAFQLIDLARRSEFDSRRQKTWAEKKNLVENCESWEQLVKKISTKLDETNSEKHEQVEYLSLLASPNNELIKEVIIESQKAV